MMTETTTPPAAYGTWQPAPPRPTLRFGSGLRYVLLGFPLALGAFVAASAGLSLGLGTLAVVLGVPVLAGTLATARRYAAFERRRAEAVTGAPLPAPRYRTATGDGLRGRARALADPQSWRDLGFMFLALLQRTVTFTLALTWTLGGLGELLYATWSWSLPRDDNNGLLDLAFGISSKAADLGFHTAVGAVLLATAVPVIRALVALEAGLVRGLLAPRPAAARYGD
ncbi:sensor domain-containing protein [Streptomyces physcomitrii]|uniref:sensor domain-containing protein n=1 Tax=Streptomyces physcomitrii TaxID=2724184 RepID=UPI0033D2CC2C